jgi:hypothetical protein
MAARTLQSISFAMDYIAVDFRRNILVTVTAGIFGDGVIEPGNLDCVGVAPAGEVERMPEAVVSLHCILAEYIVRGMAVVACRCRVMT